MGSPLSSFKTLPGAESPGHCGFPLGFPLSSRTSALAITTLSPLFVMCRLSFLTTGLHLSVEPSDCTGRSLICAVTMELQHHTHPGLERALETSSDASCSCLSCLPHSASLLALNIKAGLSQVRAVLPHGAGMARGPAWSRQVPQLQRCSSQGDSKATWHWLFSHASKNSPEP